MWLLYFWRVVYLLIDGVILLGRLFLCFLHLRHWWLFVLFLDIGDMWYYLFLIDFEIRVTGDRYWFIVKRCLCLFFWFIVVMILCDLVINLTEWRYCRDNRLNMHVSSHWLHCFAPRCRLILISKSSLYIWGESSSHSLIRELGSERCKSVWSISIGLVYDNNFN